jgi:hypothetical protein
LDVALEWSARRGRGKKGRQAMLVIFLLFSSFLQPLRAVTVYDVFARERLEENLPRVRPPGNNLTGKK